MNAPVPAPFFLTRVLHSIAKQRSSARPTRTALQSADAACWKSHSPRGRLCSVPGTAEHHANRIFKARRTQVLRVVETGPSCPVEVANVSGPSSLGRSPSTLSGGEAPTRGCRKHYVVTRVCSGTAIVAAEEATLEGASQRALWLLVDANHRYADPNAAIRKACRGRSRSSRRLGSRKIDIPGSGEVIERAISASSP